MICDLRLRIRIVGAETLEVTDGDGLMAHLMMDTVRLALFLLRADTTADSGQRGRLFDDRCGTEDVAFLQGLDETGDVDVHRTALYARRILAVEATMGLGDGLGECQTLVDLLVQGFDAHLRTEFRHLHSGNCHAVFWGAGERFHGTYLGLTEALTVG